MDAEEQLEYVPAEGELQLENPEDQQEDLTQSPQEYGAEDQLETFPEDQPEDGIIFDDDDAMEEPMEDGSHTAIDEVEDLPNYDVYESDGGESLSDGQLSLSESEDEITVQERAKESAQKPTGWTEQVEMIHLRRYIDQLAEEVKEKDYDVARTRVELKGVQQRLEELETEEKQVNYKMAMAQDKTNTAEYLRLRAQYDRVCEELSNEVKLREKIRENLDKAEYDLSKAQVEQGRLILAEDDLKKREEKLLKEKKASAEFRNKQETIYARNAVKQKIASQRLYASAMRQKQDREAFLLNDAKQSQEKANFYLQKTMTKLRQRSAEEQERHDSHVKRRMNTMLALKSDITANRENLKAIQARDRVLARAQKSIEDRIREDILAKGGNPSEEMIKKKALEIFEEERLQHLETQRKRQVEIAEKILLEEKMQERKKGIWPQLYTTDKSEEKKIVKPHKKVKCKTFEAYKNMDSQSSPETQYDMSKFEAEEDSDDEDVAGSTNKHRNYVLPDSESDTEDAANLAKPEFEGLWDQHKPYSVPKDVETGPKLPGASKMEKEVMARVLQKHREGIVTEQVAAGKKFTGSPFYSKPSVIHFKDFEVGKTYKKKVTLTNVSYSVNYCKLLGITEHLKDFIDILFDPPGQMSAGLTCDMIVTFKPMINEDLFGEVNFLAQTGPFAIALQCTTKKCDLSVDMNTVDFGVSVIGETLKRSFTLTNNGALPTKFAFYKVTGLKQRSTTTAETSLGRLTSAGTLGNVSPDSGEKKEKDTEKQEKETEEKNEEKEKAETEESEKDQGIEEEEMERAESSQLAKEDLEELMSLDGMCIGGLSGGDIGPFSSVKLEIIWQPTIPGKTDTEFVLAFDDPDSPNISINALASAIDVPVWVERETVDLKICMFDRLYQDTIIVHNRATFALRLKFEVCKELRNHLELLPKTGYIQAQSQFTAQLKFLPRPSLFEDAGQYFDKETGVLEAPMVITVADQTRPVPFTVHAVVTTSDLSFDMTDIDFGNCSIYEAVTQTVRLTNHSILTQQFGFVGIPDYVDVQPNDGFGTLLPLETIDLDIIFQPSKAKDYNFELTCKSLINREFKIKCKGVGVHPPLELSQQVVHFRATTVNDVSHTTIHVINSHTSTNEFTHPVPRIGKGEIAPVGPTSFEFIVPEGAPVSISPSVGTVEPGQKCRVHIRFAPMLHENDVRKEAVRMLTKQLTLQAQEEYKLLLAKQKQEEATAAGKKKPPPKGKSSPKGRKGAAEKEQVDPLKGPREVVPPTEDSIDKMSDAYAAAQASLLRQFRAKFESVIIPCYVASGKCAKPGELKYSTANCLHLQVHCPIVKPELVVISDSGRTTVDFGNISIGQSVNKSITLQNISEKTIDLQASSLDTQGPFSLLNSLRQLPPGATHSMFVCFMPHKGEVFQEVQEVHLPHSTLHITLRGCGVSPAVSLTLEDGVYDIGAVIVGEYREETFKIMNTSSLAVQYGIKLDSQSLLRHSKAQGIPQFVQPDINIKSLVGVQNKSGAQVFDCVPAEGIIPAGDEVEVMMTFAPDHASEHFSDGVRIELFGQEEQHVFQVVGQGKHHVMYMCGGDTLTPEIESLSLAPVEDDEEDAKLPHVPMLVTLKSATEETTFSTATRDVCVGCVRTMAVSQKKNGEWIFDNVAPLAPLGFTIDPQKGMVEAGTQRPVTITWTPPAGFDPNQPMEASINCTLKGDVTEVYRLILRGYVVSE